MIKFFRKTRQYLLSEGKTIAYFKYSIGEIALVVVGILIALQINNWNEEKKQSNTELKILEAMKENLISDIQDMETNLAIYSNGLTSTVEILGWYSTSSYDKDSLRYYFGHLRDHAFFIETTSAYENLKTIGFEIITNDSLKKNIMHIYGKKYQLIENLESARSDFVYSQLYPQLRENLITYSMDGAYPLNISDLKRNHRFYETLKFNAGDLYLLIDHYRTIKGEVESLVKQIEAQLKERK